MNYWILKLWKKHQFKIIVYISLIILFLFWYFEDDTTPGTIMDINDLDIPNLTLVGKKKAFNGQSKGELECRRVLEKLFRRSFPNIRPDFLRNNITGKSLEIDCCNEELKLGVEYNGRQHYNYVKGMHKNYEAFRLQQYRDEMKHRLCKDHGFTLIAVPYTIPVDDIEIYIKRQLQELQIPHY